MSDIGEVLKGFSDFLFPSQQYGPFHVAEDAPAGTTVAAVMARDADVRGGDSWQVNYRLESGNEEEVFMLATDRQTNEVSLVLTKVTSYFANLVPRHTT